MISLEKFYSLYLNKFVFIDNLKDWVRFNEMAERFGYMPWREGDYGRFEYNLVYVKYQVSESTGLYDGRMFKTVTGKSFDISYIRTNPMVVRYSTYNKKQSIYDDEVTT